MLTHGERVMRMIFRRWLISLLCVCSSGFTVAWLLAYNGFTLQDHPIAPLQPSQAIPAHTEHNPEDPYQLVLPCKVDGTDLVVEQLVWYEGEFLENDLGGYVVNTAAILLRNSGKTGVLHAEVRLVQGDREYTFYAETIPPGMTALVLEREGKACLQQYFSACYGRVVCDLDSWIPESVTAKPVGKGDLLVTNHSENELTHVCVYYRTCYNGGSFYMGGLAHSCCIEDLLPGEQRRITPEYFAGEYSAVVRISTGKHG